MIPLRLSLTNFMCYRDNLPPLELEGIHVACICGDNGHGKSALLDAMTWALWGQARARTQDELIYQGQQDMAVELEFLARSQRYRVVRKRSKVSRGRQGTTLLELYVASDDGFRPITGSSIDETERSIKELLHMDYDTFASSAYLLQGRADRFTASRPSERKQTLAEILDLSYYSRLETKAKERSRSIEAQIRETEGALQYMQQEIARRPQYEDRFKEVNAALKELTPQVEEGRQKAEGFQRSVDTLQSKRQELEALKGRLKIASQELGQFESQVRAHQERTAKFEEILQRAGEGEISAARSKVEGAEGDGGVLQRKAEEVQAIASEMHRLRSDNAKILEEMKELRTKFDLLSDEEAQCPLCGQPLGPEGMTHLRREFEDQGRGKKRIYKENESEISGLEAQHRSLSSQTREMEREINQKRREAQARLVTLERDVQEAQNSVPEEKTRLQEASEMAVRRRQEVEEGLKRRDSLNRDILELPMLESELSKAQVALKELMDRQVAYLGEKGTLEQSLEKCDRLQKEMDTKLGEMRGLQDEKGVYDELAVAFGKSGVQALIIESAMPQLEDDANEILGRLTENRMSLKLETQRERKTRQGDPIETLEIKIADELGTRSYETFSGGETFRINFALRIALSKLLARRAGAPLPILFIDEGFGTQDASGRERLLQAIKSVEDDFQKIFVITHIEELKDAFPVRIEVTKTEAGSTYAIS